MNRLPGRQTIHMQCQVLHEQIQVKISSVAVVINTSKVNGTENLMFA